MAHSNILKTKTLDATIRGLFKAVSKNLKLDLAIFCILLNHNIMQFKGKVDVFVPPIFTLLNDFKVQIHVHYTNQKWTNYASGK